VPTVKEEIRTLIPVFYLKLKSFIIWPSVVYEIHMGKLFSAVAAIDEIYRPYYAQQQQYYSGHRSFHAIHSQVIMQAE
jgi:hypothetical protein